MKPARTPTSLPPPNLAAWLGTLNRGLKELPTILRVDTVHVGREWAERFHCTDSTELMHVLDGQARVEFRGIKKSQRSAGAVEVKAGDTFLIPQDRVHRDVTEPDEDYRVFYVFFRWPTMRRTIAQINPSTLVAAPEKMKSHLQSLMLNLREEYEQDRPGAVARMHLILLEVLLAMIRYGHRPPPPADARQRDTRSRRTQLADAVAEHLKSHSARIVSLDDLGRRFGVSPFHLCRVFSQQFGVSITDTLVRLRIEHAKRLLGEKTLSVKQIAQDVGYQNPNYFAKVFRRVEGLSPMQYRAASAGPRRGD